MIISSAGSLLFWVCDVKIITNGTSSEVTKIVIKISDRLSLEGCISRYRSGVVKKFNLLRKLLNF